MKTILVIGAGRSSASLIDYLLKHAEKAQWRIIVGDLSLEAAKQKCGASPFAQAVHFDINAADNSKAAIDSADLVISLLPPNLHPLVGLRCLEKEKHLLTASYVSDEMKAFDNEAREKNLIFLNECGLDPGIDHLSAMKVIDDIRARNGKVVSFESFTGGLIAPNTDPDNPWRYKFTWNPRNVVMAGQGVAKYLRDGKSKYISYPQLFQRVTSVHIEGLGDFEGYANRDSLRYIATYQLDHVKTMLRGTLRHQGFCSAWNIFVQLGCCDDSWFMEDVNSMTHSSFLEAFLPPSEVENSVEERIRMHFSLQHNSDEIRMLKWSGFFDNTRVGLSKGTPAQILEHILSKKWTLQQHDLDQIVMWHRFRYLLNGKTKEIQASLVATGENQVNTAMAKTVGLPLAIAAKLILKNKINARGVQIPTTPEFYEPILAELEVLGITLHEVEREVA